LIQRLRVRFCRGDEIKFISHLDLMRLWTRALVRAGVPLAYSQGFNPHPRLSLAVPLAIGITSEAELLDIYFSKWVSPHVFTATVSQQLPRGIEMLQTHPIGPNQPALPALVRHAEYRVEVETDKSSGEIESALSSLLAIDHLPWQHQRDTGPRHYDLRPLINDLWLIDHNNSHCTIGMRLRCDNSGSGRPEQVASALGFTQRPRQIHRTQLILKTN